MVDDVTILFKPVCLSILAAAVLVWVSWALSEEYTDVWFVSVHEVSEEVCLVDGPCVYTTKTIARSAEGEQFVVREAVADKLESGFVYTATIKGWRTSFTQRWIYDVDPSRSRGLTERELEGFGM